MFKASARIILMNLSFLLSAPILLGAGTCKLCEDIRERNRQNPSSGYTYYEDYLKAQGGQKQEAPKETKETDTKKEEK